jgi:hypothetical protein
MASNGRHNNELSHTNNTYNLTLRKMEEQKVKITCVLIQNRLRQAFWTRLSSHRTALRRTTLC